jgi:hypothetical protein
MAETTSAPPSASTPPAAPDPAQVMQAIDTYLRNAYDEPPVTVRSQLSVLKSWGGPFFRAPVFVADEQPQGKRYSMRLGNRHYPHMKLRIEPSPDGSRYLFRADSHDRHVCPPPASPEYEAFRDLMEKNQRVVDAVEGAWADAGVPTFKTYLREDLARRRRGGEEDRG